MGKIFLIILIALVVVSGCASQNQPEKYTGPVEKITVGFPLLGAELETLIFIAEDNGYFKEQDLEVSIKDEPSSIEGYKDLMEGKIDLAGSGDYSFALNSFSTKNVKTLASIDKSQYLSISGRRDKGLTAPSDLKGKRIGIVQNTVSEFYLYQFLITNGIPVKDVQIVYIPAKEILSVFISDKADAVSAALPVAYQLNKSSEAGIIQWSSQDGSIFYWLLIATEDTATKRSSSIERFLRALVNSESFVRNNAQEAHEIVEKRYSNLGKDYFDFVWPKHDFAVSLDQPLLLTLENQARWAIKNNLTNATQVPNYLNFIYFDALEKVKPEAVTIIK